MEERPCWHQDLDQVQVQVQVLVLDLDEASTGRRIDFHSNKDSDRRQLDFRGGGGDLTVA